MVLVRQPSGRGAADCRGRTATKWSTRFRQWRLETPCNLPSLASRASGLAMRIARVPAGAEFDRVAFEPGNVREGLFEGAAR